MKIQPCINKFFLFALTLILSFYTLNAQNSWLPISNFPASSRAWATSFTIGDKAYVGTGGTNFAYNNDLWEYDTNSGLWSQKASVGGPLRGGAIGFAINNRGYIGLGRTNASMNQDIWEYNPSTNSWSFKAMYPGTNVSKASTFVIGGKAYIATGSSGSSIGIESTEVWEFDPSSNQFSQKSSIPSTGRDRAVGFEISNKGYIICGYGWNSNSSTSESTREVWEYDPTNDTWTQKADYPGSRIVDNAGFSIGNYGYVGMGHSNGDDFWRFDPRNNTWTEVDTFWGPERLASVSFSVGNQGFVGLGYTVTTQTIEFTDFYRFQDQTLSNEVISKESEINIYPNPFKNNLNIDSTVEINKTILLDISGKQLNIFESGHLLKLGHLPVGIYFLRFILEDGSTISKRIIKR